MNDLERTIENRGIDAEIIEVSSKTNTVSQAANALNTDENNIIKSLVVEIDNDDVLVVIRGDKRVSFDKLEDVFSAESASMASPEKVEELTGYSVGEVPPVGTGLKKVVDEELLERKVVYGGGGGRKKMLELDPRYMVDEDTVVEDVTEE